MALYILMYILPTYFCIILFVVAAPAGVVLVATVLALFCWCCCWCDTDAACAAASLLNTVFCGRGPEASNDAAVDDDVAVPPSWMI